MPPTIGLSLPAQFGNCFDGKISTLTVTFEPTPRRGTRRFPEAVRRKTVTPSGSSEGAEFVFDSEISPDGEVKLWLAP